MRIQDIYILLLSAIVSGRLFAESEYLQDIEETTTTIGASPASVPTSGSPTVTYIADLGDIGLRQGSGIASVESAPAPVQQPPAIITAIPAAELVPAFPVVNHIPPPALAPPVNAIAPVAPALPINVAGTAGADVTRLAKPFSNVPFYTVVWAETWIGGTYSTWWPYTISLDFKPVQTQAPLPGVGSIGMGTLTGKTGVTRTVVVNAAPTQGVGWAKGFAAAVGIGMAGMAV
ncbi:hypothetical protein BKA58DRAFT_437916 [Alternaria rosae]|uniref:uncharacterized protein n=1 Tax=Alternaria rosae TaxID=1187941 RepID=UPI001E8D8C2F|nr:uncharacterized protein BKA58DRAFT_437916 [Alternaria rosae]KAH6875961.1 hypothetical protein BKA58DRAFT_437916 [Alternaria rosae]